MSVALFAMVVKEMLIIISQGLQYHCRNVLEIIIVFQKIRYKNLNRKGGGHKTYYSPENLNSG